MPTLVTRGAASVRGFGFAGTTPVLPDPYFNYTTLLLHGNGTNGGQNNTFLDSSTNNFTITRNGNTTQGTFSPFSVGAGYWSNYFDGSSGYITAPGDTAFAFGTGDFTVEMWVNIEGTNAGLISHGPVATLGSWMLEIIGSTFYWQAAITGNLITASASSVLGTGWKHVAVTRASGTTRLFADGLLLGSSSTASNFNTTTGPLSIGKSYNGTYANGYMSNVRIIKGTALYTAAFTPPTAPLTAISGTSLLTCQSNRFVDNGTANSGSGFTITAYGSSSVQAFSPFAPTAAYSASTVGGSGYFDGTGDYLSIPSNTAFAFGTGDFTVEGWIYYASVASNSVRILATAGAAADCLVEVSTSSELRFYDGSTTTTFTGSTTQANAWNHIAVTRSGTSLRGYINGAQVGSTVTNSANIANTQAINFPATTNYAAAACYISNVRYLKGTALYTGSTYTIPTAPLTNISNTSLLCNFTNAAIIDNTAKNVLETVGNAQISTTQSKFGGASLYFDGTGDYLSAIYTPDFNFGTGDLTIECWVYYNSVSSGGIVTTVDGGGNSSGGFLLYLSASGTLRAYGPSVAGTVTTSVTTGQWYHIALTRSSNTWTLWKDGISQGTFTDSAAVNPGTTRPLTIGGNQSTSSNSYIDDLRITKGIARYTSNFTPQTSQWQDQ